MNIIRENQFEYNKFITQLIPRFLKALGASFDSDSHRNFFFHSPAILMTSAVEKQSQNAT